LGNCGSERSLFAKGTVRKMEEKEPARAGSPKRKSRTVVTFVAGLVLGAVLMALARPFLGARFPEAVGGKRETVEGPVAAKQRKGDRLLLTVVTPAGAVLGTFKKRVEEIDLLVETGDTVALAIAGYEPFLQDPEITRVAKPAFRAERGSSELGPADAGPDSLILPADTAARSDSLTSEPTGRWY
jgi:hypothetical protein